MHSADGYIKRCKCDKCLKIYHKIQQLTTINYKLHHYVINILGTFAERESRAYNCLHILTKGKAYFIFDMELCRLFTYITSGDYFFYLLKARYNINVSRNDISLIMPAVVAI